MKDIVIEITKQNGKFGAKVTLTTLQLSRNTATTDSQQAILSNVESAIASLLFQNKVDVKKLSYDLRVQGFERSEENFCRSRLQQYIFGLRHPKRRK